MIKSFSRAPILVHTAEKPRGYLFLKGGDRRQSLLASFPRGAGYCATR